MCDLKAYVKQKDKEDLIFDSVNLIRTEGDTIILKNLFGEERKVRGKLREVSLAKNKVIIEQE